MQSFQVLLVEDEPLLSRVIRETLQIQGFRVKTAQRGREALELLRIEHFDLMVLDIRLPDMSGLQVLESAKRQDDSLRVLLVTAYESDITCALSPVKNVEAILFKPFDIDLLFSTVRQLVRNALSEPGTVAVLNHSPHKSHMENNETLPPIHTVVSLQTIPTHEELALIYAGRVLQGDETSFSVLTAPAENIPAGVQVEYSATGSYYRFQTSVEEVTRQGCSSVWLLNRPVKVQQLQRRKHKRLPVSGQAHLLLLDQRVLRAVQGDLLDISEGGMRVRAHQGLSKGMRLQAIVEWQDDDRLHRFDVSGTITHGFGQVVDGQMIFELGIAVDEIPAPVRNPIREKLRQM